MLSASTAAGSSLQGKPPSGKSRSARSTPTASSDVVCGYHLQQVLGEGANGVVRLGILQRPNDPNLNQQPAAAAIKIVAKPSKTNKAACADIKQSIEKEAMIMHNLTHPNILALLGTAEDDQNLYLVLEFAAAGELFDRIAPDVGVGEQLAHFYYLQLIAGMTYLHRKGVCHRDLKPENLLLDENGNLKISDFGLATVFRHNGVTRTLKTPCGSPPYIAPEIHKMRYEGPCVDIWSTGVILFTLLAGNTPWCEPTLKDPEFHLYASCLEKQEPLNYAPWNRFTHPVLTLLLGLLRINSSQRFTQDDIYSDAWFNRPNAMLTNGQCNDPIALAELMRTHLGMPSSESTHSVFEDTEEAISYSQPQAMRTDSPMDLQDPNLFGRGPDLISFSQPVTNPTSYGDSMMSQDTLMTSGHGGGCIGNGGGAFTLSQVAKNKFQDLVPSDRITRFLSPCEPSVIFQKLSNVLTEFLISYKIHPKLLKIAFMTVDRRKCPLNGDISIQPMQNGICMVAFRKSRGDPLEFKRCYKAVAEACLDITCAG